LGDGLWLANAVSWLLVLVVLVLPDTPLRLFLGIPFVLFLPGYACVTALAPRKEAMSGIERVALSFGLSIALVTLIGLGLNYTPLGIRPVPVLLSLAGAVLVLSGVAWARRRRLAQEERFSISFSLRPPAFWSGRPLDRALTVVLALVIVVSLGVTGYALARPKAGEPFTEFYILGPGGKAADYPSQLAVGAKGTVTAGIINQLGRPAAYTIELLINGAASGDVGPVRLDPGQKWEGEVSFVPQTAGADQKVEFILHTDPPADAPSQSLHLWVDVTDQAAATGP